MGRRQIVLDTETTGLKPEDGNRIVEIGCVELIDKVGVRGRTLNDYDNKTASLTLNSKYQQTYYNLSLCYQQVFYNILPYQLHEPSLLL